MFCEKCKCKECESRRLIRLNECCYCNERKRDKDNVNFYWGNKDKTNVICEECRIESVKYMINETKSFLEEINKRFNVEKI